MPWSSHATLNSDPVTDICGIDTLDLIDLTGLGFDTSRAICDNTNPKLEKINQCSNFREEVKNIGAYFIFRRVIKKNLNLIRLSNSQQLTSIFKKVTQNLNSKVMLCISKIES